MAFLIKVYRASYIHILTCTYLSSILLIIVIYIDYLILTPYIFLLFFIYKSGYNIL